MCSGCAGGLGLLNTWVIVLSLGLLLVPCLLKAETPTEGEPETVKVEVPTGDMPTLSERVKARAQSIIPQGPPEDAPLDDVDSIKIRYVELSDGTKYAVPDEPSTKLERAAVEDIKPEVLERFNQRREMMLKYAAKLLSYPRLAFGVGMLTKEKLSQLIPSKEALRHPILALQGKLPKKEETATKPASRTIKQRGNDAIQQMLLSLNHLAWTHPEIIANSNEAGFALSAGLTGIGMAGNKGFGAGMEVGFSLGFNWERGAMTFELFHDAERINLVVGVAAKIAGSTKALMHIRAGDHIEAEPLSGKMYYLPGPNVMETTRTLHTGLMLQAGLGTVPPFLPFPFNLYQEGGITRTPWLRATAALTGDNRFTVQGGLVNIGKTALGGLANVAKKLASFVTNPCAFFRYMKQPPAETKGPA